MISLFSRLYKDGSLDVPATPTQNHPFHSRSMYRTRSSANSNSCSSSSGSRPSISCPPRSDVSGPGAGRYSSLLGGSDIDQVADLDQLHLSETCDMASLTASQCQDVLHTQLFAFLYTMEPKFRRSSIWSRLCSLSVPRRPSSCPYWYT